MLKELLQHIWTHRNLRDRLVVSLIALSCSVALIAIEKWTPLRFLADWELASVDRRFLWRGVEPPCEDVVILGIDEQSFVADTFPEEKLKENPGLRLLSSWPWPRRVHAMALEKLFSAGAKVVGLDLLFSTPSRYGPADDAALQNILTKNPGKVVLGVNETVTDVRRTWMMPIAEVLPSTDKPLEWCAAVNYRADADLVVRRILPLWPSTEENQMIKAFPVQIASLADARCNWALERPQVPINFPGPAATVPTHPYYMLFYGKTWERNLKNGQVFKNKIVLIGPTQNFMQDVHPTPFGKFEKMVPGVEVHAAAVGTLLRHNEPRDAPAWMEMLLILVFAAAGAASLLVLQNPLAKLLPPLVLVGLYAVICYLAFVHFLLLLPMAAPAAVLVPIITIGISWQLVTERMERRRARAALERQVSKEVADELLKEFGGLQQLLAPRDRELTLFFSDIRNFTTIFEQGDRKVLIQQLNEYLSAMEAIVRTHGGTLDKFIGDAVMAFWGAPTSRGLQEDALRAVKTALEMREVLPGLNEGWAKKNYPEIKIGIGIHAGVALVGEVGSQQRSEYTAIGDTVNTASRIEGANKATGTDILISQSVYDLVKDRVKARPVGEQALKGKAGAMMLYAVEGMAEAEPQEMATAANGAKG